MRVSWWEMRVRSQPSDAASSLRARGTSRLAQVDEDRRVRLGQARRLGGVRDHTGSDDLVGALEGGPEDDIVEHARILVRAADLVTRSLDQSAGEESAFAVRDRAMADAVARLMDDDCGEHADREGRRHHGGDPGPSAMSSWRGGSSRTAVRHRCALSFVGRSPQVRVQRWLLPFEQE
ncbi:hypothetical protein ACPF8X_03520 [Streptomyces sp. G35A]